MWAQPNQYLLSWAAGGQPKQQAFASNENQAMLARAWRSGALGAAVAGGNSRSEKATITFWRFDGSGNLQRSAGPAASMPTAPVVAAAEDASGAAAAFVMPWVMRPVDGDSRSGKLYVIWTDLQGKVTFPGVGGVTTGADGTVVGASGDGGCTK